MILIASLHSVHCSFHWLSGTRGTQHTMIVQCALHYVRYVGILFKTSETISGSQQKKSLDQTCKNITYVCDPGTETSSIPTYSKVIGGISGQGVFPNTWSLDPCNFCSR